MRIRFLGTGTSTGNPEMGCRCETCQSTDPRDRRFRSSTMVFTEGRQILIDCGPDFHPQMLEMLRTHPFQPLDGVLLTHEHYDHVGGLDDLRSYCRFGAVNLYAESEVADAIRLRIPYVFREKRYPGVPDLVLNEIDVDRPFAVAGVEVQAIRLMHGGLPIVGYRIGKLAYLTDLKTIPEQEYEKLCGLEVLVINALRAKEHISHQSLADALENIRRIQPREAYLIHMSHTFGRQAEVEKILPANVHIAYDGLEVEL